MADKYIKYDKNKYVTGKKISRYLKAYMYLWIGIVLLVLGIIFVPMIVQHAQKEKAIADADTYLIDQFKTIDIKNNETIGDNQYYVDNTVRYKLKDGGDFIIEVSHCDQVRKGLVSISVTYSNYGKISAAWLRPPSVTTRDGKKLKVDDSDYDDEGRKMPGNLYYKTVNKGQMRQGYFYVKYNLKDRKDYLRVKFDKSYYGRTFTILSHSLMDDRFEDF